MVRVLFLGGLGRSGTTLLERLLGQLPGVSPLGEIVHLWQRDLVDDETCGCGDRFSECGFWQKIGTEAFGGWDAVNPRRVAELAARVERTRHIPRLIVGPRPKALAEFTGYYAKVYRAAATVSGAQVVVDSSKHSALAFCLRHADIDLRVIHMVRDSRGVAYSWTKRIPRPEAERADHMTRYSPTRSALLWNAHNASFGVLGRLGVPVRRVRYEELLADPPGTLAALAEFAGLEPSTVDLSFLRAEHGSQPSPAGERGGYVADLGPSHSAAGNPMRFTIGSVPLRRDEAWRRSLPPRQRRIVAALTAPLLSRYGYLGASAS